MPDTKNFGQRIEILDNLLGGFKKFTFDKLHEKINEKLVDAGCKPIGEKTLYNDLKYLREYKDAPINRPSRNDPFYYYTNRFSIKDIPLTIEEIDNLKQAVEILRMAAPFKVSTEIEAIISKLESKINTNTPERSQIIQFENHTLAIGQQWLDELFHAIKEKIVLRVTYKPFHKPNPLEIVFHSYLLKEYRNRWFLFGRINETNYVTNLALDRIHSIKNSNIEFVANTLFRPESYFKNLIGVSLPRDGRIEEVLIRIKEETVPYIRTKPIHHLQETIKIYKNGDNKIKIPLYINDELISILLSHGPRIEVLAPLNLRTEINNRLRQAYSQYQ